MILMIAPSGVQAQTSDGIRQKAASGDVARSPESIVLAAIRAHFPEVLRGHGTDAPIVVVADTADRVVRVRRIAVGDRTPGTKRLSIELPEGILAGDVASIAVVREVRGQAGPLRVGAILVRLTAPASAALAQSDQP